MSETQNPAMLPGNFGWNELMTHDVEQAKAFYGGLFGWTTQTAETGGPAPYILFQNGAHPTAGMIKISPEMGPAPPHWLAYVNVTDAEATMNKAQSLGATILQPVMQVGTMGKFVVIQDPGGAVFAVWESLQS